MKPKKTARPKVKSEPTSAVFPRFSDYDSSFWGNNPVIDAACAFDPASLVSPESRKMLVTSVAVEEHFADQRTISEHNGTSFDLPLFPISPLFVSQANSWFPERPQRIVEHNKEQFEEGAAERLATAYVTVGAKRLRDFGVKELERAFFEVTSTIHFLNEVALYHPDASVWKVACRLLADVAYTVLKNKPSDLAIIQKPFSELWKVGQRDFWERWAELARQGQITETQGNPVRRALLNAVATAMSYYRVRVDEIARWIAGQCGPGGINQNLVCQEKVFETVNGVMLDQMSSLAYHFLEPLKSEFPSRFTHPFHQYDDLMRLTVSRSAEFESQVTRPFLKYGTPSLWHREVEPILKREGATIYPGSHKTTMATIIEQQLNDVMRTVVPQSQTRLRKKTRERRK